MTAYHNSGDKKAKAKANEISPQSVEDAAEVQSLASNDMIRNFPRNYSLDQKLTPAKIIALQRTIGNRAVMRTLAAHRATSTTAVIQRVFPNNANKERLEEARKKTDQEVQLDHSISQDTIKKFVPIIEKIGVVVAPKNSLYTHLQKGFAAFREAIEEVFGEIDSLEDALLNFKINLVPGYKNQTGNPGTVFDPQVGITHGKGENNAVVYKTEESKTLLELDNLIREAYRLDTYLPKNQADVMKESGYNKNLDNALGDVLLGIARTLKPVSSVKPQAFNADLWYEYNKPKEEGAHQSKKAQQKLKKAEETGQKAENLKAKKAPAEWLGTVPDKLGTKATKKPKTKDEKVVRNYPPVKEVTYTWTVDKIPNMNRKPSLEEGNHKHKNKAKMEENTFENAGHLTIKVKVTIPKGCWEHIYDRHTIEHFAGEVEAINTFWKDDPQKAITQQLLEPEISLLIRRKIDIQKLASEHGVKRAAQVKPSKNEIVKETDEDSESYDDDEPIATSKINEPANDLFFQGSLAVFNRVQELANSANLFEVEIVMRSIAPQNEELGYAILPDLLLAKLSNKHL
jgi:hypothetical protein